jgi:hypothetical protein
LGWIIDRLSGGDKKTAPGGAVFANKLIYQALISADSFL